MCPSDSDRSLSKLTTSGFITSKYSTMISPSNWLKAGICFLIHIAFNWEIFVFKIGRLGDEDLAHKTTERNESEWLVEEVKKPQRGEVG